MEKARDFASRQIDFMSDFKHLRAYGPHAFGWMMRDLNADGVAGNAALATAEKGRQMIDRAARGLIELLQDVARFDLSLFDATETP